MCIKDMKYAAKREEYDAKISMLCEASYLHKWSPTSVEYFQEYSEKNKTIKDGDITVDFWILKVTLPIEILYWPSKAWGSSNSFGSSKFILSFEMTFSPKKPIWPLPAHQTHQTH